MGIDVKKADYVPNVHPKTGPETPGFDALARQSTDPVSLVPRPAGNSVVAALLGATLSISFYTFVLVVPWQPLKRYFLGHPVAVAATCLFCFALSVLIAKLFGVVARSNQLSAIGDIDLRPPVGDQSPSGRWLQEKDAGHVAKNWLRSIAQMPAPIRNSQIVCRLGELLHRQSLRGSTRQLADDLREISARDADAIHDSYGFVRVVVWAIPMLGFLGTVIGITQTLGGLDFSNGSAAVDTLKTGLYVAFDTTALGLVLSVVAIFIQYPIERGEQRLLGEMDARVGNLVSAYLPSDETSDNQIALIADLCRGVQTAVAESLASQTNLWRETIDEARLHWQSVHDKNSNHFADALQLTLLPALSEHAGSIRESAQFASERIDRQWQRCEESIHYHSDTLSSQQLELTAQFESLTEAHRRAGSVITLQRTLESNLERLHETNHAIQQSVETVAANGMADAMRTLARAVDILSVRMAELQSGSHTTIQRPSTTPVRRAA